MEKPSTCPSSSPRLYPQETTQTAYNLADQANIAAVTATAIPSPDVDAMIKHGALEEVIYAEASKLNLKLPKPQSLVSDATCLRYATAPAADRLNALLGADVRCLGNHSTRSVPLHISSLIDEGAEDGSFLVTNLGPVIDQYQQWMQELPMVKPFYAVKCNPDPVTLRLLGLLGCGFDCATQGEIALVLQELQMEKLVTENGAGSFDAATSIVYANPAKIESHLLYAMQQGVRMTVFDGEDELLKLAKLPGASENFQLLLRIKTDDKHSMCRFSHKFGCHADDAEEMLQLAQSLGLRVAGVSFHVGSGCGDGEAYVTALRHARRIFDCAEALGLPAMTMVDIGGGFPGDAGGYGGPGMPTFQNLAAAIRAGIADFAQEFPRPISSVRFIAEPGRYFVSAATTVATRVYARKGGRHQYQALYVDDGVYGTFNNVVYDHAHPKPLKLRSVLKAEAAAAVQAAVAAKVELPAVPADAVVCLTATVQAAVVAAQSIDAATAIALMDGDELSRATMLQSADVIVVDTDSNTSEHSKSSSPAPRGQDSPVTPHVPLLPVTAEFAASAGTFTPVTLSTTSAAFGAVAEEDDALLIPSAVFGPTCDGLDQMCSMENTQLPRCEAGDWVIWENMGAYTHTAAFDFNGYTHMPRRRYCLL